jgi:glyoxylase-like metal-dependent hydrolase (beta-lactamase superfamily II)
MTLTQFHLRRTLVLLGGTLIFCLCLPAMSAAPQIRKQAPGYFRMMIGVYEITALSDGTKAIPWDTLVHNAPPGEIEALTKKAFLTEPVENSSAAYLVNTGKMLILVDTGAGQMWDTTLGKVVTNLRASGYRPDQVDEVLLTHLHFDHAGGLVDNGHAVFPNATIWVDKAEADFWLSKKARDNAPDALKPWFDKAVAALTPYQATGHLRTFSGDKSFAPGIHAIETFGHTPGDASYVIESNGRKLMVWGDLVHFAAVQFADPSVTIAFDVDGKGNAEQRQAAMHDAAIGGYYIANSHISFPGIGHVGAEGNHYTFQPVNYITIFPPQDATRLAPHPQ